MNVNKFFHFPPILIPRLGAGSVFSSKTISNITYEEGIDPTPAFGRLLATSCNNNKQYYSITTGTVIRKDNKAYYEVYVNLYDYEQAKLLNATFEMINNKTRTPPYFTRLNKAI